MANALDALIDHIPDEALRGQIREALKKQNQQKKFGLVFEDHIPESTVLYDVPCKSRKHCCAAWRRCEQADEGAGD